MTYGLVTIDKEYSALFDSLSFTDSKEHEVGVKVSTHQEMTGDRDCYRLEEKLCVTWEGGEKGGEEVFSKSWSDVIPREDHNKWK